MALASKHNVAIVPIGGGTNVTGAVDCCPEENRMIVSLDTSQMVFKNCIRQISYNLF